MATDVLRPTSHTILDSTVVNAANGYNGDLGDYATLEEGTEVESSKQAVFNFPAGTNVLTAARTAVSLTIAGEWGSGDPNDKARVLFRISSTEDWIEIDSQEPPDAWNPPGSGPNSRIFDITALAALHNETGFQIGLEFYNGNGSFPTPPDFSDEYGG